MNESSYAITTHIGSALPESYRNLIFSKWLKSLRYGNDLLKLVDAKAFYPYHHLLIDDLLGRESTRVRIAHLADDHDVVLGFAVSRGPILDYVYVNKDFRRIGIGRDLVGHGTVVYTHITKTGLLILGKKETGWKFNPYT